jgi:hypothetical protein
MLGGMLRLVIIREWDGIINRRGHVPAEVGQVDVEAGDVVVNGVIVSTDKPRYQSVPTGDVSKILILVNYPRVPHPSRDLWIIPHPRVWRTCYLLDF